METFNWKIRPDMTVESEPKVTSIKLGDGYEQRRPAGLNNHLAKYNVTVRIRKGEHQNLEAFLSRHGGVKSFLWTPPYTWTQIRVICRKWSINVGSLWVTVTTTFEQVVIWGGVMQDISQDTLNESAKLAQSARITLWEIDLTQSGGDRYFFCNEANEKGEAVTWQGRKYDVYPVDGCGFEMNGKGAAARPSLKVSNLYGMVTGMVEDLHSLVGATVIRRIVYARFLDAVNFQNGNQEADPEQESVSRWVIEQCSDLTAVSATFVLATPTETDGCVFPGRIMLANTCTWIYRSDECGYTGPAVADEFDNPTADPAKDACSRCARGCALRNNTGNFGGFLSINKLSQ